MLNSITAEYRFWLRRQVRPRVIPHPEIPGWYLALPENCAAQLRVDAKFLDGCLGTTSWPLCFIAPSIPEAVKSYYASLEKVFKTEQPAAKCGSHRRRLEYVTRTGKPAPACIAEELTWNAVTSGNVEALMDEVYQLCRFVPSNRAFPELTPCEVRRRLMSMWASA